VSLGKKCVICNADADTVEVAIDTVNSAGNAVGTRQALDLCQTHRAQGIATLIAQCQTDIEAAIAA
jgi:hypothetical protein